jgi:hypothetical protein
VIGRESEIDVLEARPEDLPANRNRIIELLVGPRGDPDVERTVRRLAHLSADAAAAAKLVRLLERTD